MPHDGNDRGFCGVDHNILVIADGTGITWSHQGHRGIIGGQITDRAAIQLQRCSAVIVEVNTIFAIDNGVAEHEGIGAIATDILSNGTAAAIEVKGRRAIGDVDKDDFIKGDFNVDICPHAIGAINSGGSDACDGRSGIFNDEGFVVCTGGKGGIDGIACDIGEARGTREGQLNGGISRQSSQIASGEGDIEYGSSGSHWGDGTDGGGGANGGKIVDAHPDHFFTEGDPEGEAIGIGAPVGIRA